ncbi:venom allergen 5-like isoform X2 [Leptopilina heterotoma]|uniref:venom allergen 5-like isoform X2 n=1 Tax=Leptopilina heterotoma TaxID=63436 RepID=UPI001CA8273A|nr:venom allergen 5-like isoform X2 [Leptopilina heterotoma]
MIQLRNILTFFIIFIKIFLISDGQPVWSTQTYCLICRDHTMCRYHLSFPICEGPTIQPHLTLEQVQEILEVHNNLRRNVAAGGESQGNPGPQPPAISIPDLVWDYELANIAQRWANHCFFDQKDQCRNVVRFKVGQNVATAGTGADQIPTNIMTTLVNEMYSEVMYFDSRQVENVTVSVPIAEGVPFVDVTMRFHKSWKIYSNDVVNYNKYWLWLCKLSTGAYI